jgi:hypothetical protein
MYEGLKNFQKGSWQDGVLKKLIAEFRIKKMSSIAA